MPDGQAKPIPPISVFIETLVRDSSGRQILLQPHQKRILDAAVDVDGSGSLRYSTIVYSAPKKSGKTQIAAAIVLYFAFVLGERGDEIYIAANSREHARSRVYKMVRDAIRASPVLRKSVVKLEKNVIETRGGVEIHTVAANAGVIAGAAPLLSSWDELWGYDTEQDRTLYDELAPVPTKKNSVRLITTYAGFLGRSELLYEIYKRGMALPPHTHLADITTDGGPAVRAGRGLFFYWDHTPRMPWQTEKYYEEQRAAPGMRKSTFLRIHRNMWVQDESGIDVTLWDRAVERWKKAARKPDESLGSIVCVGIDLGVSRDSAAVVVTHREQEAIVVTEWKMWKPSGAQLDIEATVEAYVRELASKYFVAAVYYDPWQMVRSAQILGNEGIPMVSTPQTESTKIKMGSFLMEALASDRVAVPPDDELRSQAAMASIKETPRGLKLAKSKRFRDDAIHALALSMIATNENSPIGNPADQVMVL